MVMKILLFLAKHPSGEKSTLHLSIVLALKHTVCHGGARQVWALVTGLFLFLIFYDGK